MITQLIKIYDETCDICALLKGLDAQVAEDNDLFFRQMTLAEVAGNPSHIRDYVIKHHVDGDDIDIPVYLISTTQGEIVASGVIRTIEELKNLITATSQVYQGLSKL